MNTIEAEVTYTVDGREVIPDVLNVEDSQEEVQITFTHPDYEDKVVEVEKIIVPLSIILTFETASKVYGGTALSGLEVAVTGDGFVKGEAETYTSGTITGAGEVINTTEVATYENFKENNYVIEKHEDKLSITKNGEGLAFTDETKGYEEKYDGQNHDGVISVEVIGVDGQVVPADEVTVEYSTDGKEFTSEIPQVKDTEDSKDSIICVTVEIYETITQTVQVKIIPRDVTLTSASDSKGIWRERINQCIYNCNGG